MRTDTNLLQLPRSFEHYHLVRRVRELRRQRSGQARKPAADNEHPDTLFHLSASNLVLCTVIFETQILKATYTLASDLHVGLAVGKPVQLDAIAHVPHPRRNAAGYHSSIEA